MLWTLLSRGRQTGKVGCSLLQLWVKGSCSCLPASKRERGPGCWCMFLPAAHSSPPSGQCSQPFWPPVSVMSPSSYRWNGEMCSLAGCHVQLTLRILLKRKMHRSIHRQYPSSKPASVVSVLLLLLHWMYPRNYQCCRFIKLLCGAFRLGYFSEYWWLSLEDTVLKIVTLCVTGPSLAFEINKVTLRSGCT